MVRWDSTLPTVHRYSRMVLLCQTRRNTVDITCAFNYSDNLVIINQVTPVTIQNKNHLEIIQIRTQIKLVI